MNNIIFKMLNNAINNNDLDAVKKLYESNMNNTTIAFKYAKLLKNNGYRNDAKEIFKSLKYSNNYYYAMLELAKMEEEDGNMEEAKSYYEYLYRLHDAYGTLELARIEKHLGYYDKALKHLDEILKSDRKCFPAKCEKASLYYCMGDNKKARIKLESIISTSNKSYDHASALLDILNVKDQEDLKLLKSIINTDESKNSAVYLRNILYLSKKLNIFFKNYNYDHRFSYENSQIINYDNYLAVEHIIDRHMNNKTSGTNFNKDIDIYYLFNEVSNYLIPQYKFNKLVFNDIYIIPYSKLTNINIGSNNENYLKVITLPNTKNIVTMYPVKNKYEVLEDDVEDEFNNKELIRNKK